MPCTKNCPTKPEIGVDRNHRTSRDEIVLDCDGNSAAIRVQGPQHVHADGGSRDMVVANPSAAGVEVLHRGPTHRDAGACSAHFHQPRPAIPADRWVDHLDVSIVPQQSRPVLDPRREFVDTAQRRRDMYPVYCVHRDRVVLNQFMGARQTRESERSETPVRPGSLPGRSRGPRVARVCASIGATHTP